MMQNTKLAFEFDCDAETRLQCGSEAFSRGLWVCAQRFAKSPCSIYLPNLQVDVFVSLLTLLLLRHPDFCLR